MKRLVILSALVIASLQIQAQKFQASLSAERFSAQDTSTLYLGVAEDVKLIYVDYTNLNADDAVLKVGAAGEDMQGWGGLTWTVGATTTDSLILDATSNSATSKRASFVATYNGVRYVNSRSWLWFPDGLPSRFVAITILWNSVTTGKVDIYF